MDAMAEDPGNLICGSESAVHRDAITCQTIGSLAGHQLVEAVRSLALLMSVMSMILCYGAF